MKILFGILSAIAANPFNPCPGTCWTHSGGVCSPDVSKLVVTCATSGVTVQADSCLFLPSNANFTLGNGFDIEFRNGADPSCTQLFDNHTDIFSGTFDFEQLDNCGWTWSSDPTDLRISNELVINGEPHKLTLGGVTIEVATEVDPIELSCSFTRDITLNSAFQANHTTFTQNGDTEDTSPDFTSVFSVQLNEFNYTDNTTYISDGVIVGEELQVNINFDYSTLGYSSVSNSKIGFFAEKCGVSMAEDPSIEFLLVGSNDNSVNLNCLLDRNILDIGQRMVYTGAPNSIFSKEEFNLEFAAFRFPTSGNLTAFCDLKLCIDTDCPTEANFNC